MVQPSSPSASGQHLNPADTPLLDALSQSAQRPHAPFYTPGHKRGQGISTRVAECFGTAVFRVDLPELPELDNLFAPEAAIAHAQALAAAAFGAEHTWFLVNGSTCGIMAAILATCQPGDTILLPRNVHQSAIAGLILAGAVPIWLTPAYDPDFDLVHTLTPEAVALALAQHPQAKAVLMVSPTYTGSCGDVAAIAAIAHQYQIPLLVDEAHGPHFAFHPDLPTPALAAGADLVVQSTHKVLAALTQAAMLHTQGNRIDPYRVSQALQLLQSTSPSYLLLASLDAARQQMALHGEALLTQTLELAATAIQQIQTIPGLDVWQLPHPRPGAIAQDQTRLTLRVTGLGLSGFRADEILHQTLGVTAEFPSLQHLTLILSIGNTPADVEQLVAACRILARDYAQPSPPQCPAGVTLLLGSDRPALSPRVAFGAASEPVAIAKAAGRISAELVCPYPPGIPVLLPGEAIAPAMLEYLQQILALGGRITGCSDPTLQTLKVVRSPG